MATTLTLLEVVQNALHATSGDEVASITDTPDAIQVAQISKDVYEELMELTDWPHLYTYKYLTSLNDVDAPTYFALDTAFERISCIRYDITKAGDTDKSWRTLQWQEPEEFLELALQRRSGNADVTITAGVGGAGVEVMVRNDLAPTYWTTFDNVYVVCDSYDSVEDTNGLDGSKALVRAKSIPDFDDTDDLFVIPIPENLQAMYKARVREKTFAYQRQINSGADQREANRQLIRNTRRGRARITQSKSSHKKGR